MRAIAKCQRGATAPLPVRALAHSSQFITKHDVSVQSGRLRGTQPIVGAVTVRALVSNVVFDRWCQPSASAECRGHCIETSAGPGGRPYREMCPTLRTRNRTAVFFYYYYFFSFFFFFLVYASFNEIFFSETNGPLLVVCRSISRSTY